MSGFDPDRYYTQLKAETYEPLIADLLSSAQGLSSLPVTDELTRARRAFLVVAIKKGTDFSRLLREFPALTAEELPEAAKRLPDKEGLGYQTASVSVSEEDRFAFAAAADKRTPKAQWDNLFPEGQDDIVLPLAGDAESIEDKIESWIARHNERAARKLEEARREDEQARQDNPAAKPRAGRAIEQRTIRRDPEDPSKLQTLNPNKAGDIWEPGPRLGKFMQDSFEWELYDIYQGREATGRSFSAGKVSLRDIANRALFNIDALYDNDNLRVVVSRDPHKIAEMSTGQRWRSCMSMGDGINRHYVPKDIEAGSLVAYLVHKDDVEARWPFMRQMLKPYRNGAGDTILVPAKVYCPGGMKNFRAFDAFKQRTHAFAAELTDGKSGSYRMDETLYADGDPQFVQLQSEWSEEDVRSALYAYLAGSLQEAMAEIKNNAVLLAAGRSGPHGEDPAKNITARRNVIKRLMTPDDSLTGLPRMFYRSMVRQNLGTPVDPRRVDETTRNDPVLRAQSEAFKALSSGDIAKWGFVSANLPAEQRVQAAAAVVAITDEGVGRYEPAVNAVVRSLKDISDPDARLETVLSLHTNAVGGSLFRERMSEELSNAVGEASIGAVSRYSQRILDVLKNDATHFEPIANRLLDEIKPSCQGGSIHDFHYEDILKSVVTRAETDSPVFARACALSLAHLKTTPATRWTVNFAGIILMYSRKDSPGSAELGRYVLNHLDHLPHEADRARKALSVLKCADERSELAREAEGTIVGSVSSLPATDDVLQVFTHFRDVSALSGRMEAMLFERLKDEDSVPDRFYSAAHILALSSDDPERASRALKIMRDDIVLLSEEVVAEIVEFGTSNETGMPPWGEEVVGQIEALQVAVANSAKEPAEEDIPTDPARLSPGRSGALQPSTLDC